MTSACALLIAAVCLYSTGHWFGGTVLLAYFAVAVYAPPKVF